MTKAHERELDSIRAKQCYINIRFNELIHKGYGCDLARNIMIREGLSKWEVRFMTGWRGRWEQGNQFKLRDKPSESGTI